MDCARAKEELSAYLDEMLEPAEKQQLELHIASCASCREDLAKLKSYAKTMAGLPKVKAPEDFLRKVNERIERRSEFESVIRGFFKPSANKTRAGAVLVTVVMMFAIYKLVAPQFSVYQFQPVEEKFVLKGPPVQKWVADVQTRDINALEDKYDLDLNADRVALESVPAAEKQKAGVTYEAYMKEAPETRSPVKLQAKLTAVHADGSSMSLDDATVKVMQGVENVGGTFEKLESHEAGQVWLHFIIPAAAYSNFIKQIEQIAVVHGPDSSVISDAGSIDVDLTLQ